MDQSYILLTQGDLATERIQAEQEGRDLSALLPQFERLQGRQKVDQGAAHELLDAVQRAPYLTGYPYQEPDELPAIQALRPSRPALPSVDRQGLPDRMLGAWLGRYAGCLLGKPVEGVHRPVIQDYLQSTGQWPLLDYMRAEEAQLRRTGWWGRGPFNPGIDRMPEDDDTNYTVSGVLVLEGHGRAFTSEHVADFWLLHLPARRTFTAERVAYRNLMEGFGPPESGSRRNPYREWIGAQIRADGWAYARPGDPQTAAEYAHRDARVSHVKNGIYGEMWAAAMVASAFCLDSPRAAVEAGLAQVPERSRLAESIRTVMGWYDSGLSAEGAEQAIHEAWDEKSGHGWCHTISNAMVVVYGLLWGEGDFSRSIGLAVAAGFDTDCNGATVGSVLGAMMGASRLPEHWTVPLNDRLETGLHGSTQLSIRAMASRSLALAEVYLDR